MDPYLNMVRWGSKWLFHIFCWGVVGCGFRTTSVCLAITYVCFLPRGLPVIRRGPKYQYTFFYLQHNLIEVPLGVIDANNMKPFGDHWIMHCSSCFYLYKLSSWMNKCSGAWIRNCIHSLIWDIIIHPCSTFVQVRTWRSNYIPQKIMDVITYPYPNLS